MLALNLAMGRNAPSLPFGEISSGSGHLQFSTQDSKEAKSPEPIQSSIGSMGTQFLAESQHPNVAIANHQAAQAHAKQIEGAIRLLQMQHDAILSSVLTSQVSAMQHQHIVAVERERQNGRFASGQREQINSYLGSTHSASDISQQASELQRRTFSSDYHGAAPTNPRGLHASTAQSNPPCHPHQPEQPTFRQHFDLPFAHRPAGFFPAAVSHVAPASTVDQAGPAGFPTYGRPPAHRQSIPLLPDPALPPPPHRLPPYHHSDSTLGCGGGYDGHGASGVGGVGAGDGLRPQRSGSSERLGHCGPYQAYAGTFAPPAAAAAVFPQAHVQSYFETVRAHRPLDAGPGQPAGLVHGAAQRKRHAEADPLDNPAARPRGSGESAAGTGRDAGRSPAQEHGMSPAQEHGMSRLALAPEVRRNRPDSECELCLEHVGPIRVSRTRTRQLVGPRSLSSESRSLSSESRCASPRAKCQRLSPRHSFLV
jgi:hypothetical protein